jgi:hypothetical protein
MNLAMSLLIGILSIATATMWFAAFALWLPEQYGPLNPRAAAPPGRRSARPDLDGQF